MQVTMDPKELGLDPQRWERACAVVTDWCARDLIPSAGVTVIRPGKMLAPRLFGKQEASPDAPPIRQDAIFLIASITKPMVAAGVLLLVERGILCLDERVETYLPQFGQNGKHATTIRNLLTHTSGLPDMLPNNTELRVANRPLIAFVEGTYAIKPDFPPGRGVQYQSMGFAVLGELIHQVTGKSCAQFLHDEFLAPLGMEDTALGAPDSWFTAANPKVSRIAGLRIPPELINETTWNWNSRYWRQLGAPWGGLLTTPADLARYAAMWLNGGELDGKRYLSPAAVAAATRNQLDAMRDLSRDDRRTRPWGLGWRLNWPAHSANFGDLLGPRSYGHWGATGTSLWIDPDRQVGCVILTTQPQEPHGCYLARLSNAVCAAVAD